MATAPAEHRLLRAVVGGPRICALEFAALPPRRDVCATAPFPGAARCATPLRPTDAQSPRSTACAVCVRMSERSEPAVSRDAPQLGPEFTRYFERHRQTTHENLRRVHAAGIPVAMGTDAGNALSLHGASVFREPLTDLRGSASEGCVPHVGQSACPSPA